MRWPALLFLLSACAETALPSACSTCFGRDDGLTTLDADPRVERARARGSDHVRRADAARAELDALETGARAEQAEIARLYLLAAIVEEERLALAPAVTPTARLELSPAARLEAAREDARVIADRTFADATTDEERRLAATSRERRSTRGQAAALLATACEDAITSASASLDATIIAEFRTRLAQARAERDLDARYTALDALAMDVREAVRSLVP